MRSRVPKTELELLGRVPLFSQCNLSELRDIARLGTQLDVPEGKELITEGGRGVEFFLIVDGEAECSVRGTTVAVLGPGDYFGELALLDGGMRTATIRAASPMLVSVLHASEFSSLLRAAPSISLKLLANVASRLRDAEASAIH
jgi:CRP-like cAMP-binding protein